MSTEYLLEMEKTIMMSTYRHLQGGKRNLTDYGLLHMAQGFYSIAVLCGEK